MNAITSRIINEGKELCDLQAHTQILESRLVAQENLSAAILTLLQTTANYGDLHDLAPQLAELSALAENARQLANQTADAFAHSPFSPCGRRGGDEG